MRESRRNTVLSAISRSLERARISRDSLILVALSGGADSVAMLHALIELRGAFGYRIAAAHLNHRIRGAESDRDEAFVRALCARRGIELVVERAAGLDAAMPNLEEAARDARHHFLRRTAERLGAEHIALGHHRDDQAETVLLRMLRGTGIAGLGAMDESGPHGIVRPMLSLSREDIRAYLEAIGASFVEDSSNASAALMRNRIRHELIPTLETYTPGVGSRLAELSGEMRALDAYVTREAARALDAMRIAGGELDLARFATLDPALRAPMLRGFITERIGSLRRIGRTHLDAMIALILEGPPNGEISLPGGWRAMREYSRMRLTQKAAQIARGFSVALALEGTTVVEAAGYTFDAMIVAAAEAKSVEHMPKDKNTAMFDLVEVATTGLSVRNFIPGDRVWPMGLTGTRKVKDVLIDSKVARGRRLRVPIVVAADDIVWIPGVVRSERGLLTRASETAVRISAREVSSN